MAVTRREYIFGAFLSSILCILLIILAVSSNSWGSITQTQQALSVDIRIQYKNGIIEAKLANGDFEALIDANDIEMIKSIARDELTIQSTDSHFNYGLFSGDLELNVLETPTYNTIHMTCVLDIGACAASCKTTSDARIAEVRALAESQRPNPACVAVTIIDENNPLEEPAVISLSLYISLLILLFLQLLFAIIAAGLAILNATSNPTEPIFGLPGCLWINVITAVLGITVLFTFGIYYSTSGLNQHLAFSYIATGLFVAIPELGFSYWMLIGAILCSALNIGLIELRKYLLERDPPPPTIKVENHSDGTIFLY